MHRIDGATAAVALPAPGAVVGTPGYFAHGDLDEGVPYTVPTPDWANAVQEEICGVIEGAEIALDKTQHNQLLAAVTAIAAAQFGEAGITADVEAGEMRFFGGGLCKVGKKTASLSEGETSTVFRTAFPNACLAVIPVAINTSGGTHTDLDVQMVSVSTTGFTVMVQLNGSDGSTIDGYYWIAVGY